MGYGKGPPTTSHDLRRRAHIHVVYSRQVRKKQLFMQELKDYRRKKEKTVYRSIVDDIGPRWYQVLSIKQRKALDTLKEAIKRDSLLGQVNKTAKVIRAMGIYPRLPQRVLKECIRVSSDPMEWLAVLYQAIFDDPIEVNRASYSLNAKLMLSGILYLGLNGLIRLLTEKFRPDDKQIEISPKLKAKPRAPIISPYLEEFKAVIYERPILKRPPPAPLPNLDDLNEPYEIPVIKQKPPPPPPPPPPPKKRIPQEVCDEVAGIKPSLIPVIKSEAEPLSIKPPRSGKGKHRKSSSSTGQVKKVYGIQLGLNKKTTKRRRKPKAPSTGVENSKYTINGIHMVNGKPIFVLGNITVLPAQGELIHGGHASVLNQNISIYCGIRGHPPPPKPASCDCVKTFQKTVIKYVKESKCFCGHLYDFGNEPNTFPSDELPFFLKPTGHTAMQFNYDTIFNLDAKDLHVKKDFKRIWETESLLQVGGVPVKDDDKKKKKKEMSSKTCLGPNPGPKEYLKCALRFMKSVNVAARLPDLHLVPELKEWMRRRIYGPLNEKQKTQLLLKSGKYWRLLETFAKRGFGYGHIPVPREEKYAGVTTWLKKQKLDKHFEHFTKRYRVSMYKSYAKINNLFWRTMFHAECPDKQFRRICFSYLYSTPDELQMIPYVPRDSVDRARKMGLKRYVCLPKGAEDLDTGG